MKNSKIIDHFEKIYHIMTACKLFSWLSNGYRICHNSILQISWISSSFFIMRHCCSGERCGPWAYCWNWCHTIWKIMHFKKNSMCVKYGTRSTHFEKNIFFPKCFEIGYINPLWKKFEKQILHRLLYFS